MLGANADDIPTQVCSFGTDRWRQHEEVVVACAIPGTRDVLSGSMDAVVNRWDDRGRLKRQFVCWEDSLSDDSLADEPPTDELLFEEPLTNIASSDSYFAVGNDKGGLWIFDIASSQKKKSVMAHGDEITAIEIAPDDSFLTAGMDGRVIQWSPRNHFAGDLLFSCQKPIGTMRLSPDGKESALLIDDVLFVLNLKSKVATSIGEFGSIKSMMYLTSERNQLAVTSPERGTIDVIGLQSKETRKLADHGFDHLALSDDGHHLAAARRNEMLVINLQSGQNRNFSVQCVRPTALSFYSSDSLLLSGRLDVPRIIDIRTGKMTNCDRFHQDYISDVQLLEPNLVLSASGEGKVKLWNHSSGEIVSELSFHDWNLATSAHYFPDTSLLTIGVGNATDRAVEIWNFHEKKRLFQMRGHEDTIHQTVFSEDGRFVLSRSGDGLYHVSEATVRIWQVNGGQCVATIRKPYLEFNGAAWHPREPLIITCDEQRIVDLWDLQGNHVRTLKSIEGSREISVSQGSENALLICFDNKYGDLNIFSLQTGKLVAQWDFEKRLNYAAISPSGRKIAVGLKSGEIQMLEVDTKETSFEWKAHKSNVTRLAFSIDEKLLASGSYDATVSVWKIE